MVVVPVYTYFCHETGSTEKSLLTKSGLTRLLHWTLLLLLGIIIFTVKINSGI